MNENQKVSVPPGIGFGDILYMIFRHKGKIILIFALGLMATASLPFIMRPKYESQAKLLIKYVVEGRSPPQVGNQSTVQPVDDGQTIINTELEILSSRDLALQVVDAIGADKILGAVGGVTNREKAAAVIQNPKNLIMETPRKSNVILIVFQHPDPVVAQAVVGQLIDSYEKKHAEIHRGGAFDEFLTQETDQLHSRLLDTEEALRKEKNKLGMNSVEQASKFHDDQISKIREKLLDAQAQLAEKQAAYSEMIGSTNFQSGPRPNAAAPPSAPAAPPEVLAQYTVTCRLLESMRTNEQALLLTFTPESSFVKDVRQRISENERIKNQLEQGHPELLSVRLPTLPVVGGTDAALKPQTDLLTARAEIEGLRAKIRALQGELDDLQKGAAALVASESSILELQRRKAMEEGYYSNFSESLEQSHISERLGAGKISNISIIEAPSAARPVASKLQKMMAMTLLGSVGGALGLAFLLEFFLDRSIKRPIDVETKIGLPFFLAIPRLGINGKSRSLGFAKPALLTERTGYEKSVPKASAASAEVGKKNGNNAQAVELAPWDSAHKLGPFSEALRDRLITYFEANNLTHKPKLVAVTSCGGGAGVSTVAAGLAGSLSETGEGNVLLVDMNALNGAAHHFYKGDLKCDIDDALEADRRGNALVHDNLYIVSETPDAGKMQSVLPNRFKHLVPKLKASDFDYIVFDMPAVSQISLTPRLARFMDVVLLVVESEKTDLDVVKRASSLLANARTNVGIVLNKTQTYVPRALKQEI